MSCEKKSRNVSGHFENLCRESSLREKSIEQKLIMDHKHDDGKMST